MTRYVLTEKISKILIARKYSLVCKISQCPLQVGLSEKEAKLKDVDAKCPMCKTGDPEDGRLVKNPKDELTKFYWRCKKCGYEWPPLNMGEVVESKQQRGGRSKLYNAKNYDDSHIVTADKKWKKTHRRG
jgi:predicted Zn-ribbon and HTH transcriptional regulator